MLLKTKLFIILAFFLFIRLKGPNVAIELNYPIAWPGLENKLTIVAEGLSTSRSASVTRSPQFEALRTKGVETNLKSLTSLKSIFDL